MTAGAAVDYGKHRGSWNPRLVSVLVIVASVGLCRRSAAADPDAPSSDIAGSWPVRRTAFSYELRLNASALAMPEKTFHLDGVCSTISGTAPVSIYGDEARDGLRAIGGGGGGRIGLVERTRPFRASAVSWIGLRAVVGLDLDVHHARNPLGFRPIDGALCSEVTTSQHWLEYESAVLLTVQPTLDIGPLFAFGSATSQRWRGLVLGLAWAPSVVHGIVFGRGGSTSLNPLGAELTLDWVTLEAKGSEPHFRLGWFVAPPTGDACPAMMTLSAGIVSY